MANPGILLIAEPPSPHCSPLSVSALQAALTSSLDSGLPVFLVLGFGNPELERFLEKSLVDWGVCPDSLLGEAYMVAFGVHSTQHWNGWIIDRLGSSACPQQYRQLANDLGEPAHSPARPYCCQYPIALSRCHGFDLVRPWQPLGYQPPWLSESLHEQTRKH